MWHWDTSSRRILGTSVPTTAMKLLPRQLQVVNPFCSWLKVLGEYRWWDIHNVSIDIDVNEHCGCRHAIYHKRVVLGVQCRLKTSNVHTNFVLNPDWETIQIHEISTPFVFMLITRLPGIETFLSNQTYIRYCMANLQLVWLTFFTKNNPLSTKLDANTHEEPRGKISCFTVCMPWFLAFALATSQ